MKFSWNRGICVTKVSHISDNTYSWSTAYYADVIMEFLGKCYISSVCYSSNLVHAHTYKGYVMWISTWMLLVATVVLTIG
jgi:hypothetical protein